MIRKRRSIRSRFRRTLRRRSTYSRKKRRNIRKRNKNIKNGNIIYYKGSVKVIQQIPMSEVAHASPSEPEHTITADQHLYTVLNNNPKFARYSSDYRFCKIRGIKTTVHYVKRPNSAESDIVNVPRVGEMDVQEAYPAVKVLLSAPSSNNNALTPDSVIYDNRSIRMRPGNTRKFYMKLPRPYLQSKDVSGIAQGYLGPRGMLMECANGVDFQRAKYGKLLIVPDTDYVNQTSDDKKANGLIQWKAPLLEYSFDFYLSFHHAKF